jgi:hypothetical protein
MTKASILWPGDRMRSFFRAHILRETRLDSVAADNLADALTRATNRMLVWDAAPSVPVQDVTAEAFDPYKFSVMVVLAKQGKDQLLKRLGDIEQPKQLRAIAEAQHLAVADHLTSAEDIRHAMVVATERRLADRKAAAS